jgi:molybdopterin molybdotransferase
MMRGLASAHGVMVVPPHGVQLGETVLAFALPWGPPLPTPEPPGTKPKSPARPARKAGAKAADPAGPVDWSALLG